MARERLEPLALEIFNHNVKAGWWDEWPCRLDRHQTATMLVVTELAEAAEGARKDLMDDHLPHHRMFEVELADALIRLLDMAGAYQIKDLEWETLSRVMAYTAIMELRLNKLEQLDECCVALYKYSRSPTAMVIEGISAVLALCGHHRIDIFPILREKFTYNQHRADHKRENRAKVGGKKF